MPGCCFVLSRGQSDQTDFNWQVKAWLMTLGAFLSSCAHNAQHTGDKSALTRQTKGGQSIANSAAIALAVSEMEWL